MIQDLRFAFRSLARSPGFTAVAVLTLAMGIAATASTFAVVKGLLFDPLPYPEPHRLAQVWTRDVDALFQFMPLSTPDFLDLEESLTSFEAFGTFAPRRFNIGGEGAESVEGALCTPGVFRAFNVPPLHGRWFTSDEAANDAAAAVVVLSHALWQRRFASNPDAIGRTLRLDGRDFVVIGVMPRDFELLSMWTRDRPLSLWTPLVLRRGAGGRANYWMASIARLKAGVSTGQAGADLGRAADEIRKSAPDTNARRTFWLMPLQHALGGLPALRVAVLLGAAWTLLVLAGQTVAGMMFARGITRQSEIAVRLGLGASRVRIARLVLSESLLLAAAASALGVLLMLWFMDALAASLPASVMPRSGLAIDRWLLGCVVFLAVVIVQMSGLAPAMLASKTDVVGGLKEGGISHNTARKAHARLRMLVVIQVALALVLVSTAMQLSQTYRQMVMTARPVASASVVTAAVAVKGPAYDDGARRAFWERLVAATAALPGVSDAAVTSKLPFEGGVSMQVLIDDEAYDPRRLRAYTDLSYVSPRFFAAINAPLLHGRLLQERDYVTRRSAVVINRAMASRYWPGQSPIGHRVSPAQPGAKWAAEVVGVVEDMPQVAERPAGPEMYFPYSDEPRAEAFLVVRSAGGVPAPPFDRVREELRRLDPDLALSDVTSMQRRFDDAGRVLVVIASVVDGLTAAVLALAALGLYGTLSFTFARRRRDIGVRVALGASPREIVALVVRQALVWVAAGATIGIAGSWVLARSVRAIVEDAGALDPGQLGASIVIVLAASALAAWLPARRAVRVDPMEALRAD
jgi:predicted permease